MRRVESFGIIPFRKNAEGQIQVLLILHHQGNHWGFPKGKANVKEKPLESAEVALTSTWSQLLLSW